MRKFSAHYIITGTGVLLNKGIVVTSDQGVITEIIDTNGAFEERSSVEFYSGIITPGFVDANLSSDPLSPAVNLSESLHQKFIILDAVNAFVTNDLFTNAQNGLQENRKICIGLKSNTSNDQEALFKLIKDLLLTFPMISLTQIITWATHNSAEVLSRSDRSGTIEVGKQPGLNLLAGLDMERLALKSTSTLKKLI